MSDEYLEALKLAERLNACKEDFQEQVEDFERRRNSYESEIKDLKRGAPVSSSRYKELDAQRKELNEELELLKSEETSIRDEINRYQELRDKVADSTQANNDTVELTNRDADDGASTMDKRLADSNEDKDAHGAEAKRKRHKEEPIKTTISFKPDVYRLLDEVAHRTRRTKRDIIGELILREYEEEYGPVIDSIEPRSKQLS